MEGLVFTIHQKFSSLFISLKVWVIHLNKTNYSFTVKKVGKEICLFTIHYFFLQFIKKIGLFIIFRPSIFTIYYFLAHYSLFIINKGHYSLIIIPHPDPHIL